MVKGRQPRHLCRTMLPQQLFNGLKDIRLTLLTPAAAFNFDSPGARLDPHIGARTQERIASHLLATLV